MTTALPRAPEAPSPPRRRWPLRLAVAVIVGPVVLVAALAALFVVGHLLSNRAVPSFPSLTAAPDPSLHGTVAYYDGSGCVRLISASGARSADVLCGVSPKGDPVNKRKEDGPQLAWRADGRLEVTMFWMTGRPAWVPSWQKLVDPRTGKVTDVPAAQLPAGPSAAGRATVSPSGDTVSFTSDSGNGKVRVSLRAPDGTTRTLMSAQGPGEYTYGVDSAFWSPTWSWVAVNDGRILVVTTGAQPQTRVLVENAGDSAEMPRFAVTAADLLSAKS